MNTLTQADISARYPKDGYQQGVFAVWSIKMRNVRSPVTTCKSALTKHRTCSHILVTESYHTFSKRNFRLNRHIPFNFEEFCTLPW